MNAPRETAKERAISTSQSFDISQQPLLLATFTRKTSFQRFYIEYSSISVRVLLFFIERHFRVIGVNRQQSETH